MSPTLGQGQRLTALRAKHGLPPPESVRRDIEAALRRFDVDRASSSPLAQHWRWVLEHQKELAQAGTELGRRGWTIPPWIRLEELAGYAGLPPGRRLDGAILRRYARDPALLNSLHTSTLSSPMLRKWRPLYRQCVHLALREEYLTVVPSLLLLLEGLITFTTDNKHETRPHRALKRFLARVRLPVPAVWLALDAFSETLFTQHDFARGSPRLLNRHWIMHGRGAPRWGRADCIRMFQAIEVASHLWTLKP